MTSCILCGSNKNPYGVPLSGALSLCLHCIRNRFKEVKTHIHKVHTHSRKSFGLPETPPRARDGKLCQFCVNECVIKEGGRGYCGIRINVGGKLEHGSTKGNVSWYFDALPTNCVGEWICAAGTEAGYPQYSHCPCPEYGYKNFAVFYRACSFNCLFCQNWNYKKSSISGNTTSPLELASCIDDKTSCICFFGGDPTPQLPHSILTSRKAIKSKKNKILRICWETNGSMNPGLLKEMARLTIETGGCIKVDLKAFHEELHRALCGVTNRRTLENFKLLYELTKSRPEPPALIASTPIIPGYVDEVEVANISRFIYEIDPSIPYSLLIFNPHFLMEDLPITPKEQVIRCFDAAEKAGLKRVKIGNIHLL